MIISKFNTERIAELKIIFMIICNPVYSCILKCLRMLTGAMYSHVDNNLPAFLCIYLVESKKLNIDGKFQIITTSLINIEANNCGPEKPIKLSTLWLG